MNDYDIQRLSSTGFGAIVTGMASFHLTRTEYTDLLYQDFLQHRVLVIRGAHAMSIDDLESLAKSFSLKSDTVTSFKHSIEHHDKYPGLENVWHSDNSWRKLPPYATCIQLVKKPNIGGDTVFLDLHQAYRNLPGSIKTEIKRLKAIHSYTLQHRDGEQYNGSMDNDAEMKAIHPLVIKHHETQLPAILFNPLFTTAILNGDVDTSQQMLDKLYKHIYCYPELQYRHKWQNNDIVIWDNRSVAHYACSDYYPEVRKINRVMLYKETSSITAFNDADYTWPTQIAGEIGRIRKALSNPPKTVL